MMFQYSHIEDIDDDAFNIHILEKHMAIDLYIEDVDDDGLDDDVPTKPLPWVEFEHFQDKLGVVRKDLPRKGE